MPWKRLSSTGWIRREERWAEREERLVLRTFQTAEQDSGRSSAVTSLALIDVDIRELLKVALSASIPFPTYLNILTCSTLYRHIVDMFLIETNYIVSMQYQLR